MKPTRKLWQWLAIVFVLSFAALGWLGREIYLAAPPIPDAVRTAAGTTLYTGEDIHIGQQAWLKAGGQQLGTVWGHGSYVAPDWSADWLHREAAALRDVLAAHSYGYGSGYAALSASQQAGINEQVKAELRANTYDTHQGTITVTPERSAAI